MRQMPRREFGLLLASIPLVLQAQPGLRKYKAAIIGHTGKGDYGHGLDLIFNDHPRIEVVAFADPALNGKAKAPKFYAAFGEMLEREKPDLVSVATRWTDEHFAMCMAALKAGAHLFTEKPFTQTLDEADQILTLAKERNRKIAVAHQMRLAPSIRHLKSELDSGLIGDLLEIRAHGKQDTRAGGEDMIVLGTHLFDLMRLFAGDPRWCTAQILQDGKEVTRVSIRKATEGIGPILGNEIIAQFSFAEGVVGSFTSRAKNRDIAGHWGLHFIGTKGVVRVMADVVPTVWVQKGNEWSDNGKTDQWQRLPSDPTLRWSKDDKAFGHANRRLVDDWLAAIDENREPVCSGYNGMKAIEMCMGVFEAGLSRGRVSFPLTNRKHPLAA
ncbi:MAG TPA: Gfo/Idh/MocA family oxidoreductase [Verrucomicrobiae bacterium]|nr:Gfo/Idh/MocA family oxidoreductase [Verrucomicrobiae bacterium]